MSQLIVPSSVSGTVSAPPSKSVSVRAAAAACLNKSEVRLFNFSQCDDALYSLKISQALGAEILHEENCLLIRPPRQKKASASFSAGESALCFRLFSLISPFFSENTHIEVENSLIDRNLEIPFSFFNGINLNITKINSNHYKVSGKIDAIEFNLPQMKTSQWLSALLFIIPLLPYGGAAKININSLISSDYVQLTLNFLKDWGVEYNVNGFNSLLMTNNSCFNISSYTIESDWSSAACFLCAGAIAGDVTVTGLDLNSYQPDKLILEILNSAGVLISVDMNSVKAHKPQELKAFDADLFHAPDLFPIVSILAAYCNGTSSLHGIARLRNKESDRLSSITDMLRSFGVNFAVVKDSLIIQGGKKLKGSRISTYGDHRIAMAAAIAALTADSDTIIDNKDCVKKSYPNFWADLEKIKA